jgi:hypothetical protein
MKLLMVHEAPSSNGSLQPLVTPDGYHVPLCCGAGLPHMGMRPPADLEMDNLPHVILANDNVWNSSCVEDEFSIFDLILDSSLDTGDQDPRVNDRGDCTLATLITASLSSSTSARLTIKPVVTVLICLAFWNPVSTNVAFQKLLPIWPSFAPILDGCLSIMKDFAVAFAFLK